MPEIGLSTLAWPYFMADEIDPTIEGAGCTVLFESYESQRP